jgi:hypothetical protein
METDHTSRSTFQACPRKYQLKFIEGIESEHGSAALRYGITFHKAIEIYYQHIAENGWTRDGAAIEAAMHSALKTWDEEGEKFIFQNDFRTWENLVLSFMQFCDNFAQDHMFIKILSTERIFHLHYNPTEEVQHLFPRLEPFVFTGRMDAEIEISGRPWITEVKTTSQPIQLQQNRLHRSPQMIGYVFAGQQALENRPDGIVVLMHQITSRMGKTGSYGKLTIDFSRVPQVYSSSDISNWFLGQLNIVQNMQECYRRNFFPMDMSNCYQFGKCTYCNICEQGAPLSSIRKHGYIYQEPWKVTNDLNAEHVYTEVKFSPNVKI